MIDNQWKKYVSLSRDHGINTWHSIYDIGSSGNYNANISRLLLQSLQSDMYCVIKLDNKFVVQ